MTKTRFVLLQVRKHRLDPGPQPGMQIDWIARDVRTPQGFGAVLVALALAEAIDLGARALIVEPDDEATREMWQEHHRFVPLREAA